MAKKLTEKDWNSFSKSLGKGSFRYKILDVEDGVAKVEFLDTIYETEEGEQDLVGNVWKREWAKLEAKVLFNGEPCVLSFGWRTNPMFRTFRARCQENKISPDDLKGTVWTFEKKGPNSYNMKYLGKGEVKHVEVNIPDKSFDEVVSVVGILKEEPELISDGISEEDFIKALAIRTNNKVQTIRNMIPELEKKKLITRVDGKVFLVE